MFLPRDENFERLLMCTYLVYIVSRFACAGAGGFCRRNTIILIFLVVGLLRTVRDYDRAFPGKETLWCGFAYALVVGTAQRVKVGMLLP